jgi:GNAT superfamily N-acetyltransferase
MADGDTPSVSDREIALRDGSHAAVRPIRSADRVPVSAAFQRLSPESRYHRFLAPTERLSEPQLAYLTEVDHHDHEALIAYEPESRVVDDRWQGRGLGTALCQLLAERARDEGIERFVATLLATNYPMLHVIESLGPATVLERDGTTVTIEVAVPREGIGEPMRGVLRAAARGLAELARIPGTRRR